MYFLRSNIALCVLNVIFYLYISDKGWDICWERGSALKRPDGELAAGSVPGKLSYHSGWLKTEFSLLPHVRLSFPLDALTLLWLKLRRRRANWQACDKQRGRCKTDSLAEEGKVLAQFASLNSASSKTIYFHGKMILTSLFCRKINSL